MTTASGIFPHLRERLFGQRDLVDEQLRDIALQGSGMAHLAHAFAFLLIILFSAGSLVALAGEALAHVIAGWQQGAVDVPASISVAVSTLLVPCMDVAMLYAASMLRLLASRRADAREMRLHVAVLAGVAIIEAATYTYMSALYEHPATIAAWVLIVGRAFTAPLIGVYLSMARTLPVTSRDILYQAELASGAGVIRDVVTLANDPDAPLSEKMALYRASAPMTRPDGERLDTMIDVVQRRVLPVVVDEWTDPNITALPPRGPRPSTPTPSRRARRRRRRPAEPAAPKVRAALAEQPDLGIRATARKAGVSPASASKYHPRRSTTTTPAAEAIAQ